MQKWNLLVMLKLIGLHQFVNLQWERIGNSKITIVHRTFLNIVSFQGSLKKNISAGQV